MHIEPGIVHGAKLLLSYATAAGAATYVAHEGVRTLKTGELPMMAARAAAATAAVFVSFQILPHHPAGVSEVHLILGSTLFLMLGFVPAAIGLALGLLTQGLFFEPQDLPQYAMNVTTLLVPLFALQALAQRLIAPDTAYADITYKQALALSTAYQGGVIAWVAFWVLYGEGVSVATLANVGTFGIAYMSVVLVEPLIDLAVLAGAKALGRNRFVLARVYSA
ncbi:energy-coupling factor ABC transporter permease [Thioclava sp. 'Guangxiensis']|uniref:energy-coupling factor ABC transporter permease n=1 Tax=Thioclava sp. 'Guangxiensis' TaxID=3149044 RepID=UPI003877C412